SSENAWPPGQEIQERPNEKRRHGRELAGSVSMESVGQLFPRLRHIERSAERVPEREDESHVLVEMTGRTAVVDLVLGRTEEEMTEPGWVGQPDVTVPEVEAEDVPSEQEHVHAKHLDVGDPGADSDMEKTLHDAGEERGQAEREQIVDGMHAKGGDRSQDLRR